MLGVVGNCCMQTNATTANIVGVSSLFWDKFNNSPFCPKLFLYLFVGPLTFCSTSWSDHLLVHLLAFFDFLPKRFMFPQIIRSTQLDTPCLQQSRKKNTRYDCFFKKNITRRVRRRFHEANIANGPNIVALRFAGHRTIEMLGLVRPEIWPVSNCTQQVPTLLWFHANGRKESQYCWAQQC